MLELLGQGLATIVQWKYLLPLFLGTLVGVVGGSLPGIVPSDDVLVYDPARDAWSSLPPLPEPRKGAVAAQIGRQIVVTTGSPAGPTSSAAAIPTPPAPQASSSTRSPGWGADS